MTFDDDQRFVKLLQNRSPESHLFFENFFEKNVLGSSTFSLSPLNASLPSAMNFMTETKRCRQKRFSIFSHWLTWLTSSIWILPSDLHLRLNVIVANTCSIDCSWLLRRYSRAFFQPQNPFPTRNNFLWQCRRASLSFFTNIPAFFSIGCWLARDRCRCLQR